VALPRGENRFHPGGMYAGLLRAASLGQTLRVAAVLVDALLGGSILAFSWALRDQRRIVRYAGAC
jgi:hypothetical protein